PAAPETADALAGLLRQTWRDQGAVRATFRCWPSDGAWLVLAAPVLALLAFAAAAPDPAELTVRLVLTGVLALVAAALVAVGALDAHRVCEHGLVVGLARRSRYVVPWSTVDPGRVRVLERTLLVSRHRPDEPNPSPHHRTGFLLTTRSLAVNGFDSAGAARSPFAWWVLGARRPGRLAEAVEAAMVADGYAAAGLAERAQRQRVRARWGAPTGDPLPARLLPDPVTGVDGPLLPAAW
ncbi:hypothetical protein GTR02_20925, partial [Kineococcus sp. R8]|uniref:hypothetical protein n=1 Tax=Kineococcus siccus TaxID=2696567 RepID=UPI0014129CA0